MIGAGQAGRGWCSRAKHRCGGNALGGAEQAGRCCGGGSERGPGPDRGGCAKERRGGGARQGAEEAAWGSGGCPKQGTGGGAGGGAEEGAIGQSGRWEAGGG